ncbi:MAG: prepilin-type N-terminal cleavage/methylation domain-containing protein [Lentisphaeria bacterium]|nr:prepilin-type N-terminal cleavage/methylation domain-containing protein [Lentisphaeria bacterium]
MKKYPIRSWFNLIEVTMAIAIVGIGIAGVMALFPPAIEANKVANNENYLGGVSETLMAFLESTVFSNFTSSTAASLASSNTAATGDTKNGCKIADWEGKGLGAGGFPELYQLAAKQRYGVKSADGSVTALISIWKGSAVGDLSTTGSRDTVTLADDSLRVYVEVSWPAQLPYANRQKKVYVFDCFAKDGDSL